MVTKWDCLIAGGEWVNYQFTFDNIFQAMKTLFIMATGSQWSDIMYYMASTTNLDNVHRSMNYTFWIYFSIFFMVVGSFFLLNLFVGVVISTFNSE